MRTARPRSDLSPREARRARAARASASRGSRTATTRALRRMAPRFYADVTRPRAGRTPGPRRHAASARCATCSSPAPTPSSTDAPNAHRACDDFHRSETRRALVLDPADAPPGDRPRPRRRAVASTRPSHAARPRARGGRGRAPPRRRTRRCSSSVFLPGRLRPARHARPAAASTARYADLRADLEASTGRVALGCTRPRRATRAGQRPRTAASRASSSRGKVGFLPGIDYANPDLSHFHSRHFWETGLITDRPRPAGSAAGSTATAAATTRCRACRWTTALSPVLRSGRAPVAAVSSPGDAQLLDPGRLGRRLRRRPTETWGAISARGARRRRAPRAARAHGSAAKQVADQLAPYQKDDKGDDPLPRAVAYPEDSDFGDALRNLAGAARRCRSGSAWRRSRPTATSTPTTTRPRTWARRSATVSGALAAFQADLEARGVADRVLTLVWSRVRPPARGRTTPAAPTTAPAASPGCRARARRRRAQRLPGPRPARPRGQPRRDASTSAASTRACSSSGSAPTPPR